MIIDESHKTLPVENRLDPVTRETSDVQQTQLTTTIHVDNK